MNKPLKISLAIVSILGSVGSFALGKWIIGIVLAIAAFFFIPQDYSGGK